MDFGNELSVNTPSEFLLLNNYPNPFNPSTTIEFGLATSCLVKIKIWNILGQIVAMPINKHYEAGTYKIIFNASNLVSGIYFYQIEAGNFSDTKKMVLTR